MDAGLGFHASCPSVHHPRAKRNVRPPPADLGGGADAPGLGLALVIDSSGPRAVKLVQNGTLKTYPGFPHGMLTTHADVLNPDLLAFIQS